MSEGAPEPLGGQPDFAQGLARRRKLGTIANLLTSPPEHYVMGVADFARGTPRRAPQAHMACSTFPRTVSTPFQLTILGRRSAIRPGRIERLS